MYISRSLVQIWISTNLSQIKQSPHKCWRRLLVHPEELETKIGFSNQINYHFISAWNKDGTNHILTHTRTIRSMRHYLSISTSKKGITNHQSIWINRQVNYMDEALLKTLIWPMSSLFRNKILLSNREFAFSKLDDSASTNSTQPTRQFLRTNPHRWGT